MFVNKSRLPFFQLSVKNSIRIIKILPESTGTVSVWLGQAVHALLQPLCFKKWSSCLSGFSLNPDFPLLLIDPEYLEYTVYQFSVTGENWSKPLSNSASNVFCILPTRGAPTSGENYWYVCLLVGQEKGLLG